MTFLEKAKKEHRISNENHTIQDLCPSDLGYEQKVKCKAIIGAEENEKDYICRRCWEREMPGTEPKEDAAFTDDLLNQGYNKGLNDAWELVKKIVLKAEKGGLNYNDFKNIFGVGDYVSVLEEFTPQEALAKLKAYEEAQKIKLGEIVIVNIPDEKGIVIVKCQDGEYKVLMEDFDIVKLPASKLTKTGRFVALNNIIEQIGE